MPDEPDGADDVLAEMKAALEAAQDANKNLEQKLGEQGQELGELRQAIEAPATQQVYGDANSQSNHGEPRRLSDGPDWRQQAEYLVNQGRITDALELIAEAKLQPKLEGVGYNIAEIQGLVLSDRAEKSLSNIKKKYDVEDEDLAEARKLISQNPGWDPLLTLTRVRTEKNKDMRFPCRTRKATQYSEARRWSCVRCAAPQGGRGVQHPVLRSNDREEMEGKRLNGDHERCHSRAG